MSVWIARLRLGDVELLQIPPGLLAQLERIVVVAVDERHLPVQRPRALEECVGRLRRLRRFDERIGRRRDRFPSGHDNYGEHWKCAQERNQRSAYHRGPPQKLMVSLCAFGTDSATLG